MKLGTFFVTSALLMTMAGLTACPSARQDSNASQIQQGNEQLSQALHLEGELATRYSIFLSDIMDPAGRKLTVQTMAQDYNWRHLTKNERLSVKEKLAAYLSSINQVLGIDAKKGLYVTNKEAVLGKRDSASSFQKSLETFEKIVGENFEPRSEDLPAPVFVKAQQA